MKNKSLFAILLFLFFACTNPTNVDTRKFINIIGKWQDDNSTVEYLDDGSFKGQWGNRAATGIWQVHKDTLKMKFVFGHEPYYIITKYTKDKMVIKSIADGEVFTKIRIE